MRNISILLLTLLSVGCVSVPVERKFPSIPESLSSNCPDLKTIPEGSTKLSELLHTVVDNYGQYHECQIRVESWQEWYNTQKQIFDSVK